MSSALTTSTDVGTWQVMRPAHLVDALGIETLVECWALALEDYPIRVRITTTSGVGIATLLRPDEPWFVRFTTARLRRLFIKDVAIGPGDKVYLDAEILRSTRPTEE